MYRIWCHFWEVYVPTYRFWFLLSFILFLIRRGRKYLSFSITQLLPISVAYFVTLMINKFKKPHTYKSYTNFLGRQTSMSAILQRLLDTSFYLVYLDASWANTSNCGTYVLHAMHVWPLQPHLMTLDRKWWYKTFI